MKINAKDLCSIKDIQELKSVDSINNILKVINSEINSYVCYGTNI